MFLKKKIDLDYDTFKRTRVPILTQDSHWLEMFGDSEDKNVQMRRKELEDLLVEQKEVEVKKRELVKTKRKTMAEILNLSHEVNKAKKTESIKKLEECQDLIVKVNQEIEDLTFRAEMIPTQIRKANYELLKATIKISYDIIDKYEVILEDSTKEVEELKEKLRELLNIKGEAEEKVNGTYSFLHGILGGKEMEKLDKDMLK